MAESYQNKQLAICFLGSEQDSERMEAFVSELERLVEAPIQEAFCFIGHGRSMSLPDSFERRSPNGKGRILCRSFDLSSSFEMPHHDLWDLIDREVLTILTGLRGNTLHIDAYSTDAHLHAVLVMMQYAGRFPNPAILWYQAKTPSGVHRLTSIKLPIRSLDLRIRRDKGISSKAVYDLASVRSEALRACLNLLISAARIPGLPILLLGEKGTGKTRLIESVYAAVKDKPVQTILCGSLQPELAMSTLFGYSKGAFTGADRDSKGLIGEAAGGIVFFDEVQDLPRPVQRMLVRFLQDPEHLYRPLGSSAREYKADVEVVFASHKCEAELADLIDPDLFDRINMVKVRVPPLRSIREDVAELWRQVWTEHSRLDVEPLDPDHPVLQRWFAEYSFPGNLRSLVSLVLWYQVCYIQANDRDAALAEAMANFEDGVSNTFSSRVSDFKKQSQLTRQMDDEEMSFHYLIKKYKKDIVQQALKQHGNYSAAARALSVDEKTIRNIISSDNNPN